MKQRRPRWLYGRLLPSLNTPSVRHPFTLIELLVVISIIAILASMLLPVLSRAKEMGRQVVCTGNLKQFGIAFYMYVADNDDLLMPLISSYWPAPESTYTWAHVMGPYIAVDFAKHLDIPSSSWCSPFGCTNLVRGTDPKAIWHCPSEDKDWWFDYGPNYNTLISYDDSPGNTWYRPRSFSQLTQTSNTIVIADMHPQYGAGQVHGFDASPADQSNDWTSAFDSKASLTGAYGPFNGLGAERHRGRVGYFTPDGHVERRHIEELADGSAESNDRWGAYLPVWGSW